MPHDTDALIDAVLTFWFGTLRPDGTVEEATAARWWRKDPAFDAEIRERFGTLVERAAAAGDLDAWRDTPRGAVALVVLLDQFSRNIYRDTAAAFANDPRALEVARHAFDVGHDRALPAAYRYILLMPFMHTETRDGQRDSVARWRAAAEQADSPAERRLFEAGLDFAIRHAEIVERFGRYPHRNAILGRDTTPEEADFLTRPGSSF